MSRHKSEYRYKYEPVELPKEKKDYFRLECPSCKSKVEASDVNINDKIAKCTSCSVIFSFEDDLNTFAQQKTVVEKPAGIEKMYIGDDLELSIKNPYNVLGMIAFCTSPLFILITGAIYFEEGKNVAGILCALLICLFMYNFFRVIIPNRKKVYFVANRDSLTIEYPKGSLSRNKVFKTRELEQIYVTKSSDGTAKIMAIMNTPNGQVHRPVINYMKSITKAKYIEDQIESHLGIPNKKVANEVK